MAITIARIWSSSEEEIDHILRRSSTDSLAEKRMFLAQGYALAKQIHVEDYSHITQLNSGRISLDELETKINNTSRMAYIYHIAYIFRSACYNLDNSLPNLDISLPYHKRSSPAHLTMLPTRRTAWNWLILNQPYSTTLHLTTITDIDPTQLIQRLIDYNLSSLHTGQRRWLLWHLLQVGDPEDLPRVQHLIDVYNERSAFTSRCTTDHLGFLKNIGGFNQWALITLINTYVGLPTEQDFLQHCCVIP